MELPLTKNRTTRPGLGRNQSPKMLNRKYLKRGKAKFNRSGWIIDSLLVIFCSIFPASPEIDHLLAHLLVNITDIRHLVKLFLTSILSSKRRNYRFLFFSITLNSLKKTVIRV